VDEIPGQAGPWHQCKRGAANRQYGWEDFRFNLPGRMVNKLARQRVLVNRGKQGEPCARGASDDMAAAERMQVREAGLTGVSEPVRADAADETLVRAAQAGDRAAFGALYQRYARMVHGILLARVPRAAAEDLLQDVFLQAMPRLASLRDATRFGGWLAAIARNRASDYHRQRRPTEELEETFQGSHEDSGRTANGQVAEGLFFLEAIRSLPEAYREPLILRFAEGLTGPEIAERTGLKHGSVRVNLYRGMQMLREKLEKK